MARPLCIERPGGPGGWYHDTPRGSERQAIFRADYFDLSATLAAGRAFPAAVVELGR